MQEVFGRSLIQYQQENSVILEHAWNGTRHSVVTRLNAFVVQDGRSSSLTAPYGPSQQAVIRSALSEANMSVSELAALEMHGTGTPLGDPIEMGAATAILQLTNRPLQLSAAKSIMGHAEPAAGSVGIAHAVSMLSDYHTSMLPHLRGPNPHIVSLLEASKKSGCIKASRQPGARICVEAAEALGVSAFAFQGTNAHVILQPYSQAESHQNPSKSLLSWSKQRFWYSMNNTASLHQAIARQGQALFQSKLSRAALAFFMDHQIQDTALFPGAGMFDMACTACKNLSGDCSLGFALLEASIAAPLPVRIREEQLLICCVDTFKGQVQVQSQNGQDSLQTHLKASFGKMTQQKPVNAK